MAQVGTRTIRGEEKIQMTKLNGSLKTSLARPGWPCKPESVQRDP